MCLAVLLAPHGDTSSECRMIHLVNLKDLCTDKPTAFGFPFKHFTRTVICRLCLVLWAVYRGAETCGRRFCASVLCVYVYIYTGCPRRNGQNFGRVFLMLIYTDITQNTYIQSWTVTEIMAREVWNLTALTHLLITKYILKLAGICGFCNVNICT